MNFPRMPKIASLRVRRKLGSEQFDGHRKVKKCCRRRHLPTPAFVNWSLDLAVFSNFRCFFPLPLFTQLLIILYWSEFSALSVAVDLARIYYCFSFHFYFPFILLHFFFFATYPRSVRGLNQVLLYFEYMTMRHFVRLHPRNVTWLLMHESVHVHSPVSNGNGVLATVRRAAAQAREP